MKCLTRFKRRGCERRRSSMVGIADKVMWLGTMAGAIASKLSFGKFWNFLERGLRENRKKLR